MVLWLAGVTTLLIGVVSSTSVTKLARGFEIVAGAEFPSVVALEDIRQGQTEVMQGLNAILIKNLAKNAELRDADLPDDGGRLRAGRGGVQALRGALTRREPVRRMESLERCVFAVEAVR